MCLPFYVECISESWANEGFLHCSALLCFAFSVTGSVISWDGFQFCGYMDRGAGVKRTR
jgi:hypothetical protein